MERILPEDSWGDDVSGGGKSKSKDENINVYSRALGNFLDITMHSPLDGR
jgi:hypothetical protein